MALTEKQKTNIVHLDFETLSDMLHECDEQFMSVEQYHEYTGMNKRTIYAHIDKGLLETTIFCGRIAIYMGGENDKKTK